MFYGLLLIGVVGALVTKFDARGLAWTMRVMAAAQLGIFLVAAALDWASLPVFTIFYFWLWLVADEFFKKSTRASRDALASL